MSVIGIDLGTTFSAVATLGADGRPVVIANAEGELTTPSAILFEEDHAVIVGKEAKRAALVEPECVALDVKRYMGDTFYPKILRGKQYSPVVLSSMILRKLVQDATQRLGEFEQAVVTVPAYFDEGRRQATVAACRSAGIKLLDIINEPTAAALAYAFSKFLAQGGRIDDLDQVAEAATQPRNSVVYDLGGGTFDVTVLQFGPGSLRVLATAGDVQLGGRDWDQRIYDHLAEAFLEQHKLDPRDDPVSRQQLIQVAEDVKKELSRRVQARYLVNHAGQSLRGVLTRERFEELTADLLYRTESRVTRVVKEAGLVWELVDEVLLVGGSTRMPQVTDMLKRVTGGEPNRTLSPEEAVAHGAAIHAAMCVARGEVAAAAGDPQHQDRSPADSGTAPDEAEAPGAAAPEAEAGRRFLARLGERIVAALRAMRTTSASTHTLGVVVRTRDGKQAVKPMIPRNTPLPVEVSGCFGTESENQRRVSIHVVEGESRDRDACCMVGTCHIASLPAGLPKGSPIEVTFRYDRSGRLHVKALHLASGTWAETTIERAAGVNPEQIRLNQDILARHPIS